MNGRAHELPGVDKVFQGRAAKFELKGDIPKSSNPHQKYSQDFVSKAQTYKNSARNGLCVDTSLR